MAVLGYDLVQVINYSPQCQAMTCLMRPGKGNHASLLQEINSASGFLEDSGFEAGSVIALFPTIFGELGLDYQGSRW
uniref:Uncharacterized protein n=1 Tax=Salix viminalis TaxID=40686 RepID=A0A6N2N2Z6_SALVM